MILMSDFTIGYRERTLLEDVDAMFPSGQLTALIGRNGSGKSTLLRALAGLNRSYTGKVLLDGYDIKAMSSAEMSRSLALVTTERIRVPNLTCESVTAIGRAPYTNWMGRMSREDHEAVTSAMKATGMSDYAHRTMDTMSDGECQRVMIARALAQDTPTLLLDEPTSFLDLSARYELCRLLGEVAHTGGKTVVFSTHELDLALDYCDCIALLSGKKLEMIDPKAHPSLTVREIVERF